MIISRASAPIGTAIAGSGASPHAAAGKRCKTAKEAPEDAKKAKKFAFADDYRI